MYLDELEEITLLGSDKWCAPKDIRGISYEKVRQLNILKLESPDVEPIEPIEDEIIVDYVMSYMRNISNFETFSLSEFIRAVIFLIREMYSVSASVRLGYWGQVVTTENAEHTISMIRSEWPHFDDITKGLFRTFILEFYGFYAQEDYDLGESISSCSMAFLHRVFQMPPEEKKDEDTHEKKKPQR